MDMNLSEAKKEFGFNGTKITPKLIRDKYRELANKYYPRRPGVGDEEKMKKINEAYTVIKK